MSSLSHGIHFSTTTLLRKSFQVLQKCELWVSWRENSGSKFFLGNLFLNGQPAYPTARPISTGCNFMPCRKSLFRAWAASRKAAQFASRTGSWAVAICNRHSPKAMVLGRWCRGHAEDHGKRTFRVHSPWKRATGQRTDAETCRSNRRPWFLKPLCSHGGSFCINQNFSTNPLIRALPSPLRLY